MIIKSEQYSNESYSGCDIVATIMMPDLVEGGKKQYTLGEISTVSYSIHMDKYPVRAISSVNAKDYVLGPRTIAGSLVFTVFNKHVFLKIMDEIGYQNGYRFLTDELPPFDIVMSYANEYGYRSKQIIYGVRLVNEGSVVSINDVYTENTYQFVAMDIDYLRNENRYNESHKEELVNNEEYVEWAGFPTEPTVYHIEPENTDKYELQCRIYKLASDTEPGEVRFKVVSARRDGYIYVTSSTGEQKKIQIEGNLDSTFGIMAYLYADTYKAYWSNGEISTDTIAFIMPKIPDSVTDEIVAPIIERIQNDQIDVFSNNKYHTHILYENPNGMMSMKELAGKRVQLINLIPDSEYRIASCRLSTDEQNIIEQSPFITVKTKKIGASDFEGLAEFADNNLGLTDIKLRSQVINLAMKLTIGNSYLTIVDSIIDANKKYVDDFNSLDSVNYPSLIEYQEAYDNLCDLIRVSNDLISMSIKYTNDMVNGYNYQNMALEAPKIIDTINTVLKITIKANDIMTYVQYKNGYKPCEIINKKDFKIMYDETNEPYYTYKFNGRPGYHYFVYAVSSDGIKSPRCDLYMMTEEEKSEMSESQSIANAELNNTLVYTYNTIDEQLCSQTSTSPEDVAYEKVKSADVQITFAPNILSCEWNKIEVSTQENDDNLYAVISEYKTAVTSKYNYKEQIVNGTAAFTTENDGIMPSTKYSIWIEKDNVQISSSIIVKTPEKDSDEETETVINNEYFVEELTDKLDSIMQNANIEKEARTKIDEALISDYTVTKSNFVDKAIEYINESLYYYNYLEQLYICIYKFMCDVIYDISSYDFNKEVVSFTDSSRNKLAANIDCTAYIRLIKNKTENIEKIQDLKKNDIIEIDQDYSFEIIYFKNKSSYEKYCTGFILFNNINGSCRIYKLDVEVK